MVGARDAATRRWRWRIGLLGSLAVCGCHLALPYEHSQRDAQPDRSGEAVAPPDAGGDVAERPDDRSLPPAEGPLADLRPSPADAAADTLPADGEPPPCTPPEVLCGGTCVDTSKAAGHCGGCQIVCASGVCLGGTCGLRAFVTANVFNGNLGGLAGADEKCADEALAVGMPGAFKAWLADSSASPATRFTHDGAYVLATDTVVATSWADLTDGALSAAIAVTAGKILLDGSIAAWTNTRPDGSSDGAEHCQGWTSGGAMMATGKIGDVAAKDASWTKAGSAACSGSRRLYCFEQ